jgi:hypothetical protein
LPGSSRLQEGSKPVVQINKAVSGIISAKWRVEMLKTPSTHSGREADQLCRAGRYEDKIQRPAGIGARLNEVRRLGTRAPRRTRRQAVLFHFGRLRESIIFEFCRVYRVLSRPQGEAKSYEDFIHGVPCSGLGRLHHRQGSRQLQRWVAFRAENMDRAIVLGEDCFTITEPK